MDSDYISPPDLTDTAAGPPSGRKIPPIQNPALAASAAAPSSVSGNPPAGGVVPEMGRRPMSFTPQEAAPAPPIAPDLAARLTAGAASVQNTFGNTVPRAAAPPALPTPTGAPAPRGGSPAIPPPSGVAPPVGPAVTPLVNPTPDQVTAAGGTNPATALTSSAPGTAIVNGKVLTAADIANAGNRVNTVPAASFSNPGAGVLASELTGGKATPEQITAIANPTVAATGAAPFDQGQAELDARSDIASILNEDPRSPLGVAARNARMNLSGIKTSAGRYGGGGGGPYSEVLQGLLAQANSPLKSGLEAQKEAAATERERMRETGENTRAATREDAEVKRAQISKPGGAQITLGDGTLGLIQPDGSVIVAKGADGKPIRPQAGKVDAQLYQKTHGEYLDTLAPKDPTTGGRMVPDENNPGKLRPATPRDLFLYDRMAHMMAGQHMSMLNGEPGQAPTQGAGQVFVDKAGNRATRNADGSYTPVQ